MTIDVVNDQTRSNKRALAIRYEQIVRTNRYLFSPVPESGRSVGKAAEFARFVPPKSKRLPRLFEHRKKCFKKILTHIPGHKIPFWD